MVHVTRIGEPGNVYRIIVRKHERKYYFVGINRGILLKRISKEIGLENVF